MKYTPAGPEYILSQWAGQYDWKTCDEWCESVGVNDRSPEEAFHHCPSAVRHAIAMTFMFRKLLTHHLVQVRALAHAFVKMNMYGDYSRHLQNQVAPNGNYEVLAPMWGRSMGHAAVLSRFLYQYGVLLTYTKVDLKRVYGNPNQVEVPTHNVTAFFGTWDADWDDQVCVVGTARDHTYDTYNNNGELIRPKRQMLAEFYEAVRPMFQPYSSVGWDCKSDMLVPRFEVRRARSKVTKQGLPIYLVQAMEVVAHVLPTVWRVGQHHNTEAKAEIEYYKARRHDVAMRVLAARADIKSALAVFDRYSQLEYLTPNFMPRIRDTTVCPGVMVRLETIGLNGKRVADVPAATV